MGSNLEAIALVVGKEAFAKYFDKDLCGVCGGQLSNPTITREERRGMNLYLFQNVFAKVCSARGEIWIEEKTLQEIDRLIEQGQPVRKQETPVFDLVCRPG